jgi:polysaccharide export outer membrane protein
MKENLRNNLIGYRRVVVSLLAILPLTGCATFPGWLPSPGPSREQVQDKRDAQGINGIQLIDVNDAVTRKLLVSRKQSLFSETFASTPQPSYVIGAGDVIEVSVWEAPPAMLFGSALASTRLAPSTSNVTTFPEQMVSSEGTINIPFAGHVSVAGHNPQWIEDEIARLLKNKANQPQVLVRIVRNATATVTVIGEVTTSARMPLTSRGEKLLDALAISGGVKQPVNKMTLQLTRGNQVQALPLDTIIRDPKQNILLQPGDVITALFQSLSFTVLGATGKNDEVNFESQGISLAQALARAGGLNDLRADARSVFIFRFEDAAALDWPSPPKTTPEGKVPVIYQVDLRDPSTFFVAQNFPVENRDVLYVSNAPAAELQKFMNLILSSLSPFADVAIIKNSVR